MLVTLMTKGNPLAGHPEGVEAFLTNILLIAVSAWTKFLTKFLSSYLYSGSAL